MYTKITNWIRQLARTERALESYEPIWKMSFKDWLRVACAAVVGSLMLTTGAVDSFGASGNPTNVILFIGDGMDDHQLTMARNFGPGVNGEFSMDQLEHRAQARTHAVLDCAIEPPDHPLCAPGEDPSVPIYVLDSAGGGTAIATGVVPGRFRVSTTAITDEDIPTILEFARDRGKRTGIVTTARLTDATPAAFAAHINFRRCEGPDNMASGPGCADDLKSAGGPGSIGEQLADSNVNVLLGGGKRIFDQIGPGATTVLDQALAQGYQLVQTPAELDAVTPGGKVLGLFARSTLRRELIGEGGRVAEFIEFEKVKGELQPIRPEPFSCVDNPGFAGTPTIDAMTAKALELLDNSKGFFLMVEGASIDKAAHARDPCGEIGEILALDRAVAVAREFANDNSNTLIIVTADHGAAAQIIAFPTIFLPEFETGPQWSPGKVAVLNTLEGGKLMVNYGTNVPLAGEHTGTTLPVLASGRNAKEVGGMMRQTDIFGVMQRAMGPM